MSAEDDAKRAIWEWIERNYPQAMASYRGTVLKRLHRVSVMGEPADRGEPDLDRINARLRERYGSPTSHENGANPARDYPTGPKTPGKGLLGAVTGASGASDRSEA